MYSVSGRGGNGYMDSTRASLHKPSAGDHCPRPPRSLGRSVQHHPRPQERIRSPAGKRIKRLPGIPTGDVGGLVPDLARDLVERHSVVEEQRRRVAARARGATDYRSAQLRSSRRTLRGRLRTLLTTRL